MKCESDLQVPLKGTDIYKNTLISLTAVAYDGLRGELSPT